MVDANGYILWRRKMNYCNRDVTFGSFPNFRVQMDYNESLKTRFMFFPISLNEINAKHLQS